MENLLFLNELIYRPILNLLMIFLEIFRWNMWLSIIFLTLTIRLLMFKQTSAWNDMQKWMSDLQPKIDEIQKKYKNDPQRLSQETMKVFKTHGKWPLKWCLMMLIQIPVFIWLFYVVRNFANDKINPDSIYSFFYFFGQKFTSVESISTNLLWMDLLAKNSILLTVFAAVFTYLQMKLTNLVNPMSAPSMTWTNVPDMSKMMWFMWIFMAFMIWSFVYSYQAWIWLYIATTTIFSVTQYSIQYRVLLKAQLMWLFGKKKWKWDFEIIEK
jgi:YidC/Oxa1 family membrane protein insertase